MSAYTYKDFEIAAKNAGLYDKMNQADILLAQKNPDAGMSILSGIMDYQKASTPEQRALIHEQVESVRKNYGGYSGGADGSGYYLQNTPSSFTPTATPDRNYTSVAGSAYDKLTGYGDYQGSKWQGNIDELGNKIAGYEDYTFNPETSELSQALRKQYAREIGRATKDTMASAAALTGGLPSSYASTAAAQAGDYYASQYVDKLMDVANLENAIYQANFSKEMNKLAAMQDLEATDYQRYLDQYDRLLSEYNAGLNLDSFNEGVYQNDVAQNNYTNEFNYGQLLDQIDWGNNEQKTALDNAITAAQYGDYSKLNALGYNTSAYEQSVKDSAALDKALTAAQYGDYSLLNQLGYDTSAVTKQEALDRAIALAELGDYSALRALGVDTSVLEASGNKSADNSLPSWNDAIELSKEGDNSLLNILKEASGISTPTATEVKQYNAQTVKALNTAWVGGANKYELEEAIDDAVANGYLYKDVGEELKKKYGITK